jgi:hypothetical protein
MSCKTSDSLVRGNRLPLGLESRALADKSCDRSDITDALGGREGLGPSRRRLQEIPLTARSRWFTISVPMARILTAETQLRGKALWSFGAYACPPGQPLDHEQRPGRRESANTGSPGVRW